MKTNLNHNQLVLTPAGLEDWELVQDFTETTKYGTFTVPKGYVTDLASVPRLFWFVLPPFGRYSQAAVIHDYIYNTCDDKHEVFYDLMLKYKTAKWKAKVMYVAVVVWGWIHERIK